jgi:hypothetical protein
MDKNIRADFYKYLNKNCKLPEEIEDKLLKLNLIITNSFTQQNQDDQNFNKKDDKNNIKIEDENNQMTSTYKTIKSSLNDIHNIEKNLNLLDTQVDMSISKLSSIIDSRNNLQNTLKEFNIKTKKILNDKEKMSKLLKYIKSYYNFYMDALSIYEFLKNESSVVKYRFTEDYKKIIDGIGFFSLNTNFTESDTYLQKYNTLKIMSINKYYEYIDKSINNNHISNLLPPEEGSFLYLLMKELGEDIELNIREKYFLYLNQEKMKNLIFFFEEESKDDSDVKPSHTKLKTKYIDIRISLIKNIYSQIFQEINNNFFNQENHKLFNSQFAILLRKIILHSFIEIVHYGELFGHNYRNDVYILQSLVKYIYNSLYDTIRPLIVSIVSLEDLIVIFDAFTKSTAIFFLNITPINTYNIDENDINKKIIEEENKEIINFFTNFLPSIPEEVITLNLFIFRNFLDINQHLMRPTLLHLIQDLQEKIYVKVSMHIKNNFNEIENDFPSFGLYEEQLNSNNKYKYFALFHYLLKRIVILYEIFNNKLEQKIVSQIITSAIETFITELNKELLNKKNLTYEFQIYIIQQILLCLQTVGTFQIDIIKVDIDMGFNNVTDAFKINYEPIIKGKMSIRQMISSYTPELMETTKDFKKILYNNLLKSYKMFINLANEFIFGTKILDIYYKINNNLEGGNKEKSNEIIKNIINNENEFKGKIKVIEDNKIIVIKKFEEQIKNIDSNVFDKIIKVFEDNIERIRNELLNFIRNDNKEENKEILNSIINLFNKE